MLRFLLDTACVFVPYLVLIVVLPSQHRFYCLSISLLNDQSQSLDVSNNVLHLLFLCYHRVSSEGHLACKNQFPANPKSF